jgi:hypothetical protein
MWLKKRASLRKEKQNGLGLRMVKAMTTGGFIGTIFATAVGFLCARTLPISLVDRSEVIIQIFFACLTLSILTSVFINAQKQFAAIFLKITAVVLLLVPVTDWLMFSQQITSLYSEGYYSVFIVNTMLLSLSICCWLISVKLSTSKQDLLDDASKLIPA